MPDSLITLTLMSPSMALCRVSAETPIPSWCEGAHEFLTISRTREELSITIAEEKLPGELPAGMVIERGFRILRVNGPLPLNLIGIFARLAQPLADAGIPIFPIATFDTDHLLIASEHIERAIDVLSRSGYPVSIE